MYRPPLLLSHPSEESLSAWVRGYNVFPSLHVANSVLVAWVFFRYRSPLAWPVLLLAVFVSASTVLVKAHYLLDILGGIGLAWIAVRLAWWGAREREENC